MKNLFIFDLDGMCDADPLRSGAAEGKAGALAGDPAALLVRGLYRLPVCVLRASGASSWERGFPGTGKRPVLPGSGGTIRPGAVFFMTAVLCFL